MKTTTLLFGAGVLITLPAGAAIAGPCTSEIDSLTKLMAARDAGAGPTAGAAGSTTGQHPPTAAMGAADPSTAASSAAAESARPQHPPTAAMNEATQGGATSPQDVQSQTRGGPTAAQQAEGARRPASEHLASAQAALEQARSFDRSGQEAQCMDAVARAKQFVH